MFDRHDVCARALLGFAIILATTHLSGCGMPNDPAGTLNRVRNGELRVGVTHEPPWTDLTSGMQDPEPSGIEADLVRKLAQQLNAKVTWIVAAETRLLTALQHRELDLAIGGFVAGHPSKTQVAWTRSYLTVEEDAALGQKHLQTRKHVMAVAAGENAWLCYVEEFLDQERSTALRAIAEESRP